MKKILFGTLLLISSLFARGNGSIDFARVTYSQPIYEYVYQEESQQVCKEVRYKVGNHNGNYYDNNSFGIDTLIGTATGAVIGSQIGKGSGRVAAQIVGGILGASVANNMRNDYSNHNRHFENSRYETKTECYNKPHSVKRKVITGYKNYFVYNGVEYVKESDRPLKRVKISHTINF